MKNIMKKYQKRIVQVLKKQVEKLFMIYKAGLKLLIRQYLNKRFQRFQIRQAQARIKSLGNFYSLITMEIIHIKMFY